MCPHPATVAVVHAALILFCLFALLKIVPMYTELFKDVGAHLPVMTQLAITLSFFCRRWLVIASPIILGFCCLNPFIYAFLHKVNRWLGLAWAGVVALLLILFFLWLTWSCYFPATRLAAQTQP
jgi:type II secretory pathway component PulF